MNERKDRSRPIWRNILIAFILLAIMGFGISAMVFSTWSQLESATLEQATKSFDAVLAQIEDQRPYVTISGSGNVEVNRELEKQAQYQLAALHLLAYEPADSRLVRVRFPFWFVKIKTTEQLNLGTLVSLLSSDWKNLDLNVTENDLLLRGPGLVLDHTRLDGGRIILWSE